MATPGNVSVGYDLEAKQNARVLRVEVKSSIGLCTPELTEEEWNAAQRYGDNFILAVVDYYGSAGQRLRYIRNPAANVVPVARQVWVYRISRRTLQR